MSASLSIKCEWIDQPAASDPLERRTWADLRFFVAGRAMTRVWDRQSHAERTSIFVPVFPIVRWIVRNWWILLYEACRWEDVPAPDKFLLPEQRLWLSRHSVRTAESGLLLPRLCVFSDGQQVCLDATPDPPNAYPLMPAEFTESQRFWLPREAVADGLREFVRTALERIEDTVDPLARRLFDNWNAIIHADPQEAEFCQAAGRLGRDPYLSHQWKPALVEFLESGFGADANRPLAGDFLDALEGETDPTPIWQWLQSAHDKFGVGDAPPSYQAFLVNDRPPATTAYRLARELRDRLGVGPARLVQVGESAAALGARPLVLAPSNHLTARDVKAVVGWTRGSQPIVVGPAPARSGNRRFLEARALFLAIYQCQGGPRLVSSAHTWSQKASRAFAAELLAPQSEILQRWTDGDRSSPLIQSLANEYEVSDKVIEYQLQNAGAAVLDN